MKKFLFVLPIVALSLFALPAVSHAQNLNTGNTGGVYGDGSPASAPTPAPADNSTQGTIDQGK